MKPEFQKVRIMDREVKWTNNLWLGLLSFGAFMLEYLSIFIIEITFLHIDIQNVTMQHGFYVGVFHWRSPIFFKEILSLSLIGIP